MAASGRPLAHDTSVVIARLRTGAALMSRPGERVYLSAAVLPELYAGSRSRAEARAFMALEFTAVESRRPLVPSALVWHAAGQLLERRSRLEGGLRIRDHLADVLILLSTAQMGGCVVTRNVRHFEAWAHLARRSGRDVIVLSDT